MNGGLRANEKQHRTLIWANASLALAGCLWGTGFLFGKIAFREMTVSENVVFRFIFASVVLAPILLQRRDSFKRRDFLLLVAATVIGVPVQFLIQFKGLQLTTVSHASLIVGTLPVLLALMSALFLHEKLSLLEWTVLLISPLGVLVIATSAGNSEHTNGPTMAGDLLVMISLCAAVVWIVLTKHLMRKYDSLHLTASMVVFGAILLFLESVCVHGVRFHFSAIAWWAAAAQGLLATAGAYLCWNWGLARVPASRAGVFTNLEPLVGSLLGVILLHETLGPRAMLGGAMILGSAIYFSRRSSSEHSA